MSLGELLDLLDGDEKKACSIINITADIHRYYYHADSLALGVRYSPSEMSFSDLMLFKWIREAVNG